MLGASKTGGATKLLDTVPVASKTGIHQKWLTRCAAVQSVVLCWV